MESNSNSTKSGGIGFTGLLTLIFIVLKLCGVITWKWVLVLSPIWICAVLFFILFVIRIVLIKALNR